MLLGYIAPHLVTFSPPESSDPRKLQPFKSNNMERLQNLKVTMVVTLLPKFMLDVLFSVI